MTAILELPRTLFGPGTISELARELRRIGIARPLFVTDRGVIAAGLAKKLVSALGSNMEFVLFDGVTENNVFADADNGAALCRQERCDGILALGGGVGARYGQMHCGGCTLWRKHGRLCTQSGEANSKRRSHHCHSDHGGNR